MANAPYKFIMISAMYENGGNTTQRLLDGHPNIFNYPFESQPGTKYVNDHLSSLYPLKYRWPVFPSTMTAKELYHAIIDEEGKVRSKTPYVSKFRTAEFDLTDAGREAAFVKHLEGKSLTRANAMEAFFVATFEAWKNHKKSGQETHYLGYSPIIGVDGDKIINDYGGAGGNGYVLHVLRNPFSAYADTKKRAVPLSIDHYMTGWIMCQHYSRLFSEMFPDNYIVLRYEDIIKDPKKILGGALAKMGITATPDSLTYPSWNSEKLEEVYPWGTIRIPTPEVNLKTAQELNKDEMKAIYARTKMYIEHFNYQEITKQVMG
jgi:hypothetical protein